MPSDPIPIANISEEIIVEENFPSDIAPEVVEKVEQKVEPDVEDKSTSISVDNLVSALRSFGKSSKSETIGKIREPEPFTGKDPKKLKTFLMQCRLYFRGSSEFDDDTKKVIFAVSYLRDVAQEWFEPGLSGLTDTYPDWLDNWDAFVDELQTNFGPFDESADVEHDLTNLRMKDTQRISDYLVRFNSLAVRCPWGESALRYRFYEGLPARLKDEICKGDGKPNTLVELRKKAQNIDARYWERVQERSREQAQRPPTTQKTPSSTTSSTTPQSSSKPAPSGSGSTSQASGSKPGKPKEAPKSQSTKPDLSGKLDSRGKLNQQERQRRIDNDLCMYCGKKGHKINECILRQNAVKARASSTTASTSTSASTSTPAQGKDSASESKKQ